MAFNANMSGKSTHCAIADKHILGGSIQEQHALAQSENQFLISNARHDIVTLWCLPSFIECV